jgi:hypothetical protein
LDQVIIIRKYLARKQGSLAPGRLTSGRCFGNSHAIYSIQYGYD